MVSIKLLSIVFDDGPSYPMCEMADKIRSYGWHAGFAIIGRKISDETVPLLKYVVDNGFQIVSHGQRHVHMEQLSSREEMTDELLLPIKTVEQKIGYRITMARLPFLAESEEVLSVAKELGLPLLGWGMHHGNDWNSSAKVDDIVEAVLGSVCDGAVGCLHVMENTYKALDKILPELKARDFCLLTPDELFSQKGIIPPLGVQINNINDFAG